MVHLSTVLSLFALYLSATVARPLPDSAIGNEVAVSAPNGLVMSDTEELNGNSMMSTPASYPSPTDQMMSSNTWSSPPSLPTDSGSVPPYTSTSPPQYSSPPQPSSTYGSGSNSWGSSPFDDCVKQCQAKYPSMASPMDSSQDTPTDTPSKTHVVWVAPTQGVLRYVPFALNASVGDTVKFIWGANNHTVTKGSELTPCNSTSDSPFASGVQQKGFTFEQVVNDTNPLFFHCAVPNHCAKGMFGIINPPNALAGPSSVGSMMQSLINANPDLGKIRTYADNATKNSVPSSLWGTNLDMSNVPDWAQESFVENVLYMRTFLAANPDAWTSDGGIDANLGGNPPVIPQEITQVALNNNSPGYGSGPASPSSGSGTSTSTVSPSPTSTGSGTAASMSNGSPSAARSGMTVVLSALAAGFFLL
jgi:plastocyanin